MKCFHYFNLKDRCKSGKQRSAPIFTYKSHQSDSISVAGGVNKSSCSAISETGAKSSGSTPTTPTRSFIELYEEKGQNLRAFSFSELAMATNNFSRMLKIGEGGFGSVYKGSIKRVGGKGEPGAVAIKKLSKDGFQGHKQWLAEVLFLGVVEHPNFVKLIGYCAVDGDRGIHRLLVYEFMQNRSLEDHLFNRAYPALSWQTRLQIALGAAEGLAYLHEELEVQVLSSNDKLRSRKKCHISRFQAETFIFRARQGRNNRTTGGLTHVSTTVVGTYGYAAPDYIETGHLTTKSDVWSFVVVLYEILTGRRSLERSKPKSEQQLLEWVKFNPSSSRRFRVIMDPRLENQYSLAAARLIAKLADCCLVKSAKDRPKMSEVAGTLKRIIQVSGEETSSSPCPAPDAKFESVEVDPVEVKPPKQMGASESAKRRMAHAHLAKLSERVAGVHRRRFMKMQGQR